MTKKELLSLVRKHGTPLMSCSAMRYDTAVKAVKEQIDAGGVGGAKVNSNNLSHKRILRYYKCFEINKMMIML